MGTSVQKVWIMGDAGQNNVKLTISGLPAGIYVLKVVTDDEEVQGRLVISR